MWPMRTVLLTALLQSLQVSSIIQCPGGDLVCPTGHSCCLSENGEYGCCPFPDAVCCPNKLHCCPVGFECNVTDRSCVKAGKELPAGKPLPAKPVTALVIPTTSVKIMQPSNAYKHVWCDRTVACKDGSTCCKNKDNQWMCCPFPQAVCCSDHLHCCPIHTKCKQGGLKCLSGNILFSAAIKIPTYLPSEASFFLKKSSKSVNIKPETIVCPDGKSECPSAYTCCRLSSGQYGCCPLPKAVCCSDHIHCCPDGYTCDVSEGTCSRKAENVSLLIKQRTKPTKIKSGNVICPDGKSQCPDGNTCCELSSGQYGCCPLPKAVCCSDRIHCCPNGYTCDVSAGTCSKNSKQLRLLPKQPAKPTKIKTGSIICPDGQSECPDGNTCCELRSGEYGCCPLPKAVCCSDHIHCCPNGYTCDVSAGTCSRKVETVPLLIKQPAKPVKSNSSRNVVCLGGQFYCPDDYTCCKLRSGQYGCCPLVNAVCCSDGIHCCPEGYTCDLSAGTCRRKTKTVRFSLNQPAKPTQIKSGKIICPDGQSECPNESRCCKLSSEGYGCCPLPKAVCCSDGIHCCPNGYTCDVSAGTCNKNTRRLRLPLKEPAKPTKTRGGSIVCPDEHSECPDGNTCCKLESGQYGCCPLPDAVCCSDGIHCCPEGYTCDVSEGTCNKGLKKFGFFQKMSGNLLDEKSKENDQRLPKILLQVTGKVNYIFCPDGSVCLFTETCCMAPDGYYSCCAFRHAVCCADRQRCCPSRYRCDLRRGLCIPAENTHRMVTKTSSLRRSRGPIVRPSLTTSTIMTPVNENTEELKLGSKGKNIKKDKIHVEKGALDEKLVFSPTKIKVFKTSVKSVTCEEQACNAYHTCCPTPSGKGHCCPLPQASCCTDGQHCCPQGFVCSHKTNKCERNSLFMPLIRNGP